MFINYFCSYFQIFLGEIFNIRGSLEKDMMKHTQQMYKVDDDLIKEKLLSNYYHNDWLIVKTEYKNIYLFHAKTINVSLSSKSCNQSETEVTSIALNGLKNELIVCYGEFIMLKIISSIFIDICLKYLIEVLLLELKFMIMITLK